MNYVQIIRRQLKSMLKDSLAVIGLSKGLDLKRNATELTIANQMDLGIDAAELRRIRSSDIPVYQCLGERRIQKQRRRKDINTLQWQYAKHRVASPDGHLRQSAQSYGAVADMMEELPVGQRAPVKPSASGQSDRETCCKNASCDLRNDQKTRSYPDYAPKQV